MGYPARPLAVLIAGSAILLGVVALEAERRAARRAAAEHVLTQFELVIEQYERDWGAYPPGDGSGRPELRRGLVCEFFPAEDVAVPDAWDLRYRRHPPGTTPPYDLWIVEAEGVEVRLRGQP